MMVDSHWTTLHPRYGEKNSTQKNQLNQQALFSDFQRYLLFLAADNTLQDCDTIADGTALDSEIIQDYKKGNLKHLQLNPSQGGEKVTSQPRV